MKKNKLLILSILILASGKANAANEDYTLIESKTNNAQIEKHSESSGNRIYLKTGGAIWATSDISQIDPELILTVDDEVVVKRGKLEKEISFSVQCNYGNYIDHWKLEIFREDDVNLSSPLKTIEENTLYNSMNIKWDGKYDGNYKLKAGHTLLFRLTAYDKENNFDKTNTGIINLVSKETEIDLSDFGEDDSKEYGEATLKSHNIKVATGVVRFTGSNLSMVDTVDVGENSYDVDKEMFSEEEYYKSGEYEKPIKVKYENGEIDEYTIKFKVNKKHYVQTGIADFYIGKNRVSGNKGLLSVDDDYDGTTYDSGRLAYFGIGKLSDRMSVTAQVDTRANKISDMFKDFTDEDNDSIFERLDDDNSFYPTYGDDSYIRYAANTQGKMYLNVNYDKSNYTWGNYNTGLTGTRFSQYDRSLYGAKVDYRSNQSTKYGDDKLNVVGFVSSPNLISSHEEFLGTGGSLYFLKNGDVSEGSEKVYIKYINEDTGLTEKTVYLEEGKDYEIDEYQGRIILTKPLSDTSTSNESSIITTNLTNEYKNYLVVDYEYIPSGTDEIDSSIAGGRVKTWVHDSVGIGATYVKDTEDSTDYTMQGTDVTLKLSDNSFITTEYSKSEGTQQTSNLFSSNGGLSFREITNTVDEDEGGEAKRIYGVLNLHDVSSNYFKGFGSEIRFWYEDKDADYSYADQDDNLQWENYGAEIILKPDTKKQIKISKVSTVKKDLLGAKVKDLEETSVSMEYSLTEKTLVGVEVAEIKELNDEDKYGTGDLLGAKIEHDFTDNISVYAKAQTTLNKDDNYESNDLYTLGGDFDITEDLNLTLEGATGDRGDTTDTQLTYDITDDYNVYVGYTSENGDTNEDTTTFGQSINITDKVEFFQENQFVRENNDRGNTNSFGFDYDKTDDYTMGIAFGIGEIEAENDADDVKRKSLSVYHKIDFDRSVIKNKFEYIEYKGTEKTTEYVTTNSISHKFSDEYRISGKFNYSISKNETLDQTLEKYLESNIGLAYRPSFTDKLNMLTRYTFLIDESDTDRNVSYEDEKSHIFEFENIYSYNARLDLGLKLAYKHKESIYERASGSDYNTKTNIYLVGLRSTYRIMKDWDIFGEYHWKVDKESDDVSQGAILSVQKYLNENFRLGIGYNFSKFDDDLRKDDYDSQGWFINIVGVF